MTENELLQKILETNERLLDFFIETNIRDSEKEKINKKLDDKKEERKSLK